MTDDPTQNAKARRALELVKADIDARLARLAAHSAETFGLTPAEVTWRDVVILQNYACQLRKITDCAFGEGEHAS